MPDKPLPPSQTTEGRRRAKKRARSRRPGGGRHPLPPHVARTQPVSAMVTSRTYGSLLAESNHDDVSMSKLINRIIVTHYNRRKAMLARLTGDADADEAGGREGDQ